MKRIKPIKMGVAFAVIFSVLFTLWSLVILLTLTIYPVFSVETMLSYLNAQFPTFATIIVLSTGFTLGFVTAVVCNWLLARFQIPLN